MIVWDAILEIKKRLSSSEKNVDVIYVKLEGGIEVKLDEVIEEVNFILDLNTSSLLEASEIRLMNNLEINAQELRLLKLYLPYALLPYYSKKHKKCYAISHFAQTLDGRIASCSGDSRWIGNEENLIHAHRMRALCDAILIGANTLDADDPSLNVRLVKGDDPIKVIIGGDKLPIDTYKAVDSSTLLFCQNHSESTLVAQKIFLDKDPLFNAKKILQSLYDRGIHSVYIEGGAFTTSNFLKQRQLDQVQIHVSPQILGSGTDSFCFEGVLNMEQSIKFKAPKFIPIGDDIMFTGNLV